MFAALQEYTQYIKNLTVYTNWYSEAEQWSEKINTLS